MNLFHILGKRYPLQNVFKNKELLENQTVNFVLPNDGLGVTVNVR